MIVSLKAISGCSLTSLSNLNLLPCMFVDELGFWDLISLLHWLNSQFFTYQVFLFQQWRSFIGIHPLVIFSPKHIQERWTFWIFAYLKMALFSFYTRLVQFNFPRKISNLYSSLACYKCVFVCSYPWKLQFKWVSYTGDEIDSCASFH